MKLKRLIIHNIASIEDACIDFDASPLNSADVFLITGKTGAGKSTLLDAICLALYDKTPRFENNLAEGVLENDDNLHTDNARQILRRNTGEGFVKLSFEGNNGVSYESKWSVWRAYNNPSGALQQRRWSLRRIEEKVEFTRVDEIKSEIAVAVGLDFTQFCRTGILAQGEFSKFLNCKDNDKATILEHITGTEIYTRIGRKIHEIAAEKNTAWKDSQKRIEGIRLLDNEELLEIENNLKVLKIKDAENEKELRILQRKAEWLNRQSDLEKILLETQRKVNLAVAESVDEKFVEEKQLEIDWNNTAEARRCIDEIRNAKNRIQYEAQRLEQLEVRFSGLVNGLAYEKKHVEELEKKISELQIFLNNQEPRKITLENQASIEIYLNRLLEGREIVQRELEKKSTVLKQLKMDLLPAYDYSVLNIESLESKIEDRTEEIKIAEQELGKIDIGSLLQEKDSNSKRISDLRVTHQSIVNFFEIKENFILEQKKLNSNIREVREKEELIKELDSQLQDYKIKEDKARSIYESQKDTVDKFAKALRSHLHVGDVCPVCRQPVASPFASEDDLDSLVLSYRTAWEEHLNLLEKHTQRLDKERAELKVLKSSEKDLKESLDESQERIGAKQAVITKKLVDFGIVTLSADTVLILEDMITKQSLLAKKLDCDISCAREQEKSVNGKRAELVRLQNCKENANKKLLEIKDAITKCNAEINVCESKIKTATETNLTTELLLSGLISGEWTHDWKSDIPEFSKELQFEVEKYLAQRTLFDATEKQLFVARACYSDAESICETIRQKIPRWKNVNGSEPSSVTNLLKLFSELNTDVVSVLNNIANAEEIDAYKNNAINTFLIENPCFTREKLYELSEVSPEQINSISQHIETVTNALRTAETAFEEARNRIGEHALQKPDMTEKETSEELRNAIIAVEEIRRDISEQIGRLRLQLDQNDMNVSKVADLKKEVESKKETYDKWSALDKYLGSADGKLFRKIAQSYVLESLIHSANHYMNSLSGRYRLCNEPGSFVIMVQDAYQGGISRAAATMSGGETFLASLALALALSDIGDRMGMDILFIDEGFGTLSGEPLQNAIETLRTLHMRTGRHVGIISHVEELRERIPVQIRVLQEGHSSVSHVEVVSDAQNL